MNKRNVIIALGMVCLSSILMAQPGPRGPREHEGPRGEAAEAVKEYITANVLPVVTEQREKLDDQLSLAEQATIAEIREGLEDLKAERMELRESFKELREEYEGEGRPELPEELKETVKEQRKAHRQLMTQAWEIADAHEDDIEALLEEVKGDAEQWKMDIRDIVETYRPERDSLRDTNMEEKGRPRRNMGQNQGRRGGGPGRPGSGFMPFHEPVAFLLFDGTLPMMEDVTEQDLTVFPNPAQQTNTLTYAIDREGPVTITLINDQGVAVQKILNEEQPTGIYSINVDISDLKSGVYIYRIETPKGVKTKKLIVE